MAEKLCKEVLTNAALDIRKCTQEERVKRILEGGFRHEGADIHS